MIAAIREEGFLFQVWPNDHPPPHTHVFWGDEEVRLHLLTGEFLDEPPTGKKRAILKAFWKHQDKLIDMWKKYETERS